MSVGESNRNDADIVADADRYNIDMSLLTTQQRLTG